MRATEELWYLLLASQREGNRRFASELRPIGLTPSQAEVLRVLEDHQPLTLTGLGELLVCETGNNPSRLTARLVALGAVERRPGGKDRREVELRLTADGSKLARRVAEIEERMYKAIGGLLAGQDVEVILAILRGFVADLPAGKALARRVARADAPHASAS